MVFLGFSVRPSLASRPCAGARRKRSARVRIPDERDPDRLEDTSEFMTLFRASRSREVIVNYRLFVFLRARIVWNVTV
jgi:hypothetical protein